MDTPSFVRNFEMAPCPYHNIFLFQINSGSKLSDSFFFFYYTVYMLLLNRSRINFGKWKIATWAKKVTFRALISEPTGGML